MMTHGEEVLVAQGKQILRHLDDAVRLMMRIAANLEKMASPPMFVTLPDDPSAPTAILPGKITYVEGPR